MKLVPLMRTISSSGTFGYKFLFPGLWIAGFTTLAFALIVQGPSETRLEFPALAFTAVVVLILLSTAARFKRVSLGPDDLIISDYITTVHVPYSQIESVRARKLGNRPPVWVTFREPTRFGKKIVFLPTYRWSFSASTHPVVADLRELAAANRDTQNGEANT